MQNIHVKQSGLAQSELNYRFAKYNAQVSQSTSLAFPLFDSCIQRTFSTKNL